MDWGAQGPSLKYKDDYSGAEFSLGQLAKNGLFLPNYWWPQFVKLGLPTDIALEYLNEIAQVVPESYIKEVPHDREIRSEVIFYPTGTQELSSPGEARST